MGARDETFLLLVNPRAGAGKAGRRRAAIESALRSAGVRFETALTTAPGHATELVRQGLERRLAGVAVVGGDGTLNEAVNGFFDPSGEPIAPDAWLGCLPCGTGGDFRRTTATPRDQHAMIERLVRAQPRPIDVGWVEYATLAGGTGRRAFLNIASFGLAGLVDHLVNESPKWMGGTPAFFLGTLRAMTKYRNRRVRLTVDDAPPREIEIVNVAVANGQFFGGGMRIAPTAKLDDGAFDVVGIEGLGPLGQVALAPSLYGGSVLGRRGISFAQGRTVLAESLDGPEPILLDVDGETPGILPARFTVAPGALRLRA